MPGINHRALEMAEKIASDVLALKVGETLEMNFKDEPMTLQRIR